MEDEYLNIEYLEPNEMPQEEPFDKPQDDDWGIHTGYEHPTSDDDPWLNEDSFADTTPSDSPDKTDASDNDWYSSSTTSEDNVDTEDGQDNHNDVKGSAISFTGYGRCECGCGSFGGHNNICTYCGHPYSAHSRYKK